MYSKAINDLKDCPEYEQMLNSMSNDIEHFIKFYKDDSRFLSGWGHSYFCEDDGSRLVYDITNPKKHICLTCNKQYIGFLYDCTFITFMRNEAIVTALKSAILYNVYKQKKYLDISKNIIFFYADNYDNFAIHAKEKITNELTVDVGGCGKIMPQGLNEAIITIRIINALELIKDDLTKSELENLKKNFFDKIVKLLILQKNHIHNIPCWLNSAIGVVGHFFSDNKLVLEAEQMPFNINEQLKKGVTESGFWYEGSIHYNFFALEGILNYFVFANHYSKDVNKDSKEIIFNMLDAAYRYAFDNDIFPNPSDGWPSINLKTYSYVYYMAYGLFGHKILPYLQHIESNNNERQTIPLTEPYYFENKISLERILFVPNFNNKNKFYDRTSESFEKYNCAILRNENFNVFFKYGHQTKSHAHPDKMNIEVMIKNNVFTKDLSNSGYVSKLCNEFHRKTYSHNTCMINYKNSDIELNGKLLKFESNLVEAECTPYKDVLYKRAIKIFDNKLDDEFCVICDEESMISYFYHFDINLDTEKLKLLDTEPILECPFLFDIKQIVCDDKLILPNVLGHITFFLEKDCKAFIAKSYDNPASKTRQTLILEKKAKKAVFKNIFTL